MSVSLDQPVQRLLDMLAAQPTRRYMLALAGLPGSGKSTAALRWTDAVNAAAGEGSMVALSMDGFHLTKAQLSAMPDPAAAFRRRGSPWTFDPAGLAHKLGQIRAQGTDAPAVSWPGFEHDVGDPVADAVQVSSGTRLILVEGLYLLHLEHGWNVAACFDERWFLDVPMDVAMERLVQRNMRAFGQTREQTLARMAENDRLNAELVLPSRARADLWVVEPEAAFGASAP